MQDFLATSSGNTDISKQYAKTAFLCSILIDRPVDGRSVHAIGVRSFTSVSDPLEDLQTSAIHFFPILGLNVSLLSFA